MATAQPPTVILAEAMRLTQDLIIPAGTCLDRAPTVTKRVSPHWQGLYTRGKDSVMTFEVDEDFIAEHPDFFEIVQAGT